MSPPRLPLPPPLSQPQQKCNEDSLEGERERSGGRGLRELRYIYMRVGALTATGSAYFSIGNTKVIASVLGPKASPGLSGRGAVSVNLRFAAFARQPFVSQSNTQYQHGLERLVTEAVESLVLLANYPRSVVDLQVLVLQDDGGLLAAALNCISLALVHAGLQVLDVMAAATVVVTGEPPMYLLDCDHEEERKYASCSSVLHVATCSSRGQICLLEVSGPMVCVGGGHPHFQRMLRIGEAACKAVGAEMRECLQNCSTFTGLESK